jgi:hypothetical protein
MMMPTWRGTAASELWSDPETGAVKSSDLFEISQVEIPQPDQPVADEFVIQHEPLSVTQGTMAVYVLCEPVKTL